MIIISIFSSLSVMNGLVERHTSNAVVIATLQFPVLVNPLKVKQKRLAMYVNYDVCLSI